MQKAAGLKNICVQTFFEIFWLDIFHTKVRFVNTVPCACVVIGRGNFNSRFQLWTCTIFSAQFIIRPCHFNAEHWQ